jgi:hypothetical protein
MSMLQIPKIFSFTQQIFQKNGAQGPRGCFNTIQKRNLFSTQIVVCGKAFYLLNQAADNLKGLSYEIDFKNVDQN